MLGILEKVEKKMKAVIDPATDFQSNFVIEKIDSPVVFKAYGMHPVYCVKEWEKIDELIEWIRKRDCIAIGEIGLDYFWIKSWEREKEREAFQAFLALAEEMKKPVIIHSRGALNDVMDILKKWDVQAIMHFFSGPLKVAKECIERGYMISFCYPIVKNPPKKIINAIPLEQIFVETDAPYTKVFPWDVEKVGETIAKLKGLNIEEFWRVIEENFCRVFGVRI